MPIIIRLLLTFADLRLSSRNRRARATTPLHADDQVGALPEIFLACMRTAADCRQKNAAVVRQGDLPDIAVRETDDQ
jgi:hypothetical protein